ncbi:MAG: hypothetical protein KAS66_16280, partial [Candidatus Omnitrophica bacterium]|nr:hypothetical protein [Candidatus Omnitrophota bacterium]
MDGGKSNTTDTQIFDLKPSSSGESVGGKPGQGNLAIRIGEGFVNGLKTSFTQAWKMQRFNLLTGIASLIVRWFLDEEDIVEGDSMLSQAIGMLVQAIAIELLKPYILERAAARSNIRDQAHQDGVTARDLAAAKDPTLSKADLQQTYRDAYNATYTPENIDKEFSRIRELKDLAAADSDAKKNAEIEGEKAQYAYVKDNLPDLKEMPMKDIYDAVDTKTKDALDKAYYTGYGKLDGYYDVHTSAAKYAKAMQGAFQSEANEAGRKAWNLAKRNNPDLPTEDLQIEHDKAASAEAFSRIQNFMDGGFNRWKGLLFKGLIAFVIAKQMDDYEKDHVEGDRAGDNQEDRVNLLKARAIWFLAGALFCGGVTLVSNMINPSEEDLRGTTLDPNTDTRESSFVLAFKEYFIEPLREIFTQIGTLNGTTAGLVQPGGYTADEAFVANLLGVFKLADEMASMNGWTVTNTLKLAKYNDLVDESTEKIINNLSNPPPPKTIKALYASFDAEASKESKAEDAKRNAELKKYGNLVDTMDPFVNMSRNAIDSLNSKLGNHLVSEESPFLVGSEYLLSSFGAGSVLKPIGLSERSLSKIMTGGKYSWVAKQAKENNVVLGRFFGYGKRGDFYLKGASGTKSFSTRKLKENEKKDLGFDLDNAKYTDKDGTVTYLKDITLKDIKSIKDALVNNEGTLDFGWKPEDLKVEDGADATSVDYGPFTVGGKLVELSAKVGQSKSGTGLDTVVITRKEREIGYYNPFGGKEALNKALEKDPLLSIEEQRSAYTEGALGWKSETLGVELGWTGSPGGEAAVAAKTIEVQNNAVAEEEQRRKDQGKDPLSEEEESGLRARTDIYTSYEDELSGLSARERRERKHDIYLEIYNAGAADDEEFFEVGRRENGTVVFQKGRRTYDAFHVAQNLDGVSGGKGDAGVIYRSLVGDGETSALEAEKLSD